MLSTILSGMRVIDLTQNVAGPFCTQVLGDLGAEIIKVERPGRGDDTRGWRPPETGGQSATFLALNRNKRSICLDLDSAEGIAVLKRLAGSADVFVHSMKPGSAEARGFAFADLEPLNPKLIYCAISAFGQMGPLAGLPGYDPLLQAFTGIMSVTGNEGDDPVRVGVSIVDVGTGMWAAIGVLAAVIRRGTTGKGMFVEASLLDTGINWMNIFIAGYLASGQLPKKLGSAMSMTAPYELFPSSDGHVFIAAGNDGLFRRVCDGLGCPDLAADPLFRTNPDRVVNRAALRARIGAITQQLPAAETVARLRRAGAPCSEMNDIAQMLASEQVAASGMIADLPVADAAGHKVVALPLLAHGERGQSMTAPPALGADTDGLLEEAGFSEPEIARLRETGTIG